MSIKRLRLRRPEAEDGAALFRLVKRCPPLDQNSRYCNLLQVTHFNQTAIVAESEGDLVGFVTGYRIPGREHVLFVWQVGVAEEARGQGLAPRLLTALIDRQEGVTHLETTVTADNTASQSAFEKLADMLGARLERTALFEVEHFEGKHDAEVLLRIGPFTGQAAVAAASEAAEAAAA